MLVNTSGFGSQCSDPFLPTHLCFSVPEVTSRSAKRTGGDLRLREAKPGCRSKIMTLMIGGGGLSGCLRSLFPVVHFHLEPDIAHCSYPLVFATITLPLSVVRWRSGFGSTLHLATATFVVEFLYSLSGALNVLLLVFTRSKLLKSQGGRSGLTPDITGIPAENSRGQRMSLRLLPRTTDLPPSVA
jgi:hypothetical protein